MCTAEGPSGSVHTAIHEAAGPMLEEECQFLPDCEPGEAVITNGYNLPAKCELLHRVQTSIITVMLNIHSYMYV